ncbi:hypothetical protein SLEP1_g31350 [Rubroshorea leprosula]|uniref:Uncharacterized protein n=1 Tax=Rubroshorea leprosula TaxID=152421 RepID=A0AAV5K928_9ROSI|nr:hypothetical protein SLEP1_g31350 [Rubroshorea leprosula]
MPPRKSRDKEVQPTQVEHVDDSPVYSEGENDPVVPHFSSPFVERSYGNPIFKEMDATQRWIFRHDEAMKQYMVELRWIFEKGTMVMRETGDESPKTLQAVSEQVVEQVRQPRPKPHPNVQQQNFFIGEGQRQHEPMEVAAPVANHGHQPQHSHVFYLSSSSRPPRNSTSSPSCRPPSLEENWQKLKFFLCLLVQEQELGPRSLMKQEKSQI